MVLCDYPYEFEDVSFDDGQMIELCEAENACDFSLVDLDDFRVWFA